MKFSRVWNVTVISLEGFCGSGDILLRNRYSVYVFICAAEVEMFRRR